MAIQVWSAVHPGSHHREVGVSQGLWMCLSNHTQVSLSCTCMPHAKKHFLFINLLKSHQYKAIMRRLCGWLEERPRKTKLVCKPRIQSRGPTYAHLPGMPAGRVECLPWVTSEGTQPLVSEPVYLDSQGCGAGSHSQVLNYRDLQLAWEQGGEEEIYWPILIFWLLLLLKMSINSLQEFACSLIVC